MSRVPSAGELDIVLAAVAQPVVVHDWHGIPRRANPAAVAAFGFDPTGVDFTPFAEKLSLRRPDGRPVTRYGFAAARALRGQVVVDELYLVADAMGQDATFVVSASPVAAGGRISGAVAVWRLVTDHDLQLEHERRYAGELVAANVMLQTQAEELEVQAEELRLQSDELGAVTQALEFERARLSAIIANAPDAVVVVDDGARIILTNPAAEALYVRPVPYGEAFTSHAELQLSDPDGRPYDPRDLPLTRSALDGITLRDAEMQITWPDGRRRDLLVNTAPIRDPAGRLVGAVAVFHDTTERKRAQTALRRQIRITAGLEERQRLARELHDSVSQSLYSIALATRTLQGLLGDNPGPAGQPLKLAVAQAKMALSDMRALIFDLRPETLTTEGLVESLVKRASFVQHRQSIGVELQLCDEPDVPPEVKEGLYTIAREALHNVVKHSRATSVSIRLANNGGSLVLEVVDNGAGFDPNADYAGHLGLQSMRERAAHLGGRLDLDSTPGGGSRVRVQVPLHPDGAG